MKFYSLFVLIGIASAGLTSHATPSKEAIRQIEAPFRALIPTQPLPIDEAQSRAHLVDRELSRYNISYRTRVDSTTLIAQKETLQKAYIAAKDACNRDFDCVSKAQQDFESKILAVHSKLSAVEARAKEESEVAIAVASEVLRALLGSVGYYEMEKELKAQASAKGLILETDVMITHLNYSTKLEWARKSMGQKSMEFWPSNSIQTGAAFFLRDGHKEHHLVLFSQFAPNIVSTGATGELEVLQSAIRNPVGFNSKEFFNVSRANIIADLLDPKKVGGLYHVQCLGHETPKAPALESYLCINSVILDSVTYN